MKLLSIDLDGTLFNTHAQPTQENLHAIQQAKQNGVTVILNTGRPMQEILEYPELVALKCPVFCHNGSQLYDEHLQLLSEVSLNLQDVKQAVDQVRHLDFGIRLQTNKGEFRGYDTIQQLHDVVAYKLIFSTTQSKEVLYEVKNFLDEDLFTCAIESHKSKIEITNKKASKGKAIELYQKMMAKPFNDIYVIGDGENDLPHFQAATVSVAMKNAAPSIRQAADFVTLTNDENGVAHAIQHIFRLV